MIAVERAKMLIESLKDSTVPVVLSMKIVEGYLVGNSVDITEMTDEVKAQTFLDKIKTGVQGYHRHAAYMGAALANKAVVDAALNSADNDFN